MVKKTAIFTSVFHRILDFKTGLDFYPGPFCFWMVPVLILIYPICGIATAMLRRYIYNGFS